MLGQTDPTNVFAEQTVQTVQTGQWMFLKDAEDKTGLSQKTLRRYIKKKALKTRRLGKTTNARIQVFITDEISHQDDIVTDGELDNGMAETYATEEIDGEEEEVIDFAPEKETQSVPNKEALQGLIEECMRPLIKRIEEQASLLADNQKTIETQNIQLRLLPDLERQAKEREEAANLKQFEIDALKKQLAEIELAKSAAESKAKDSEERASEFEGSKETFRQELELLRAEMDKLQKPWWKKWFLPREAE